MKTFESKGTNSLRRWAGDETSCRLGVQIWTENLNPESGGALQERWTMDGRNPFRVVSVHARVAHFRAKFNGDSVAGTPLASRFAHVPDVPETFLRSPPGIGLSRAGGMLPSVVTIYHTVSEFIPHR